VKIKRVKVTSLHELEGDPTPGAGEAFSRQKADLKAIKTQNDHVKVTDLNEVEGEPTAWASQGVERQKADLKIALPWMKVGVTSSGPANSPVNIAIASAISMIPATAMGLLLEHLHSPNWVSSIAAVGVWLASSAGIVLTWRRNRTRHTA